MVGYRVSAYRGGYASQEDDAVVKVAFMGGGTTQLGEATLGPVTAGQRQGTTGLPLRTATGTVPRGTRRLAVTITMARASGTYNDGMADNLDLILTKR